MNTVYKITGTYNREGNVKDIPLEWKRQEYIIYYATVGRSAILLFNDGSNMNLTTSVIEEISISNNSIILTTKNTEYHLEPVESVN